MACSGQLFNRKVALVMLALSIYGLLLVFVSTDSMNPKFLLTNIKNRYLAVFDVSHTSNITELKKDNLTDQIIIEHIQGSLPLSLRTNSSTRENGTFTTITNGGKNSSSSVQMRLYNTPPPRPRIGNTTTTRLEPTMRWIKNTLDNMHVNSSGVGNATKGVLRSAAGGGKYRYTTRLPTASARNSTMPPQAATPVGNVSMPLITLFTTFRNSPEKTHIYKNTIRNWQLLHPFVKPILYTIHGELDMSRFAQEHGWQVLMVPKTSSAGVPVLRHMFLDAQSRFNSTFYGYVNGDILFTMGLVDTLRAMLPSLANMRQILIVGRRTNFKLSPQQNITTLAEVKSYGPRGSLFSTNAQDYFISTRDGYPWKTIPDFVVGRVGYDNWLVVTALVKRMYTIDTTKTVLALHQTGSDGNFAGHSKKPKGDTYINYGLAGSRFDYSLGHVSCGQFYTEGQGEKIKISQRNKNGCERSFKKYHVSPYMSLKPPVHGRRRMLL